MSLIFLKKITNQCWLKKARHIYINKTQLRKIAQWTHVCYIHITVRPVRMTLGGSKLNCSWRYSSTLLVLNTLIIILLWFLYKFHIHTNWLYCVECPQYSIRLEALGCLCDCLIKLGVSKDNKWSNWHKARIAVVDGWLSVILHVTATCPSMTASWSHLANTIEFVHPSEQSLTFRVRRYVVIATQPVHRLQIRPIVHN